MKLIEAIKSSVSATAAADAQDWTECSRLLTMRDIAIRNPEAITYARLGAELGDDARMLIAGTVRAVAASAAPEAGEMADAHQVLLNEAGGIRIDSDARQAMLDAIAVVGSWPEELLSAVKALGVSYTSIATRAGLSDTACGASDCEGAWGIWNSEATSTVQEVSLSLSKSSSGLSVVLRTTPIHMVDGYVRSVGAAVNAIHGQAMSADAQTCMNAIVAALDAYTGTLA